MFIKSKSTLKALIVFLLLFSTVLLSAQVNTGGTANTKSHTRQIIGYITQWDAWKSTNAGLPAAGALTQLNIDYSKYTILNFSFFGVALDGSLHSGDFRNKSIYQAGVVQQPADIFMTDIYSSWDLYIMYGELEPVQYINQDIANRAKLQGFDVVVGGSTWSNPSWGLYNKPLPLPLKKEGGGKGLLELAKANGVKVMASIGGWSMCKHFPEMAADATKKAKFLEDCKKLIGMGFDGIDLDWEYPGFFGMNIENHGPADFKNFEDLVRDIRTAIGPTKLITSATSADPRKLRGFNWAVINQYMDYYNMMTYDLGGGWSNKASHNANVHRYTGAEVPFFSWDDALAELQAQGVPMSKVNFGIPFYGRGVICSTNAAVNAPTVKKKITLQPDGPVESAMDDVNFKAYDGTPNYEYIRQKTGFGTIGGWTRQWDNEAQVPYLTNGKYFLSYDDEESIAYKCRYIMEKGMAGTIVWTVYGDLELGGSVTNFGTKLKRWSNVKSPLVNKINEIFGSGPIKYKPVITAPAEINIKLGETVNLIASATDQDGQVIEMKALEGTVERGASTSGSLTASWIPTTIGETVVVVTAKDNDLQVSSVYVTIKVRDNKPVPPVVEITAPADNSEILTKTTATIDVVAKATDIDGDLTSVVLTGATSTVKVAGDIYTFTISGVEPAATPYTYTVTATDAAGLTTSAKVTVKVLLDTGCTLPKWDSTKVYTTETVCHNNVHYQARWWNQGQEPGLSEWGPWAKVGSCGPVNPGNKAPVVSISSPADNSAVKAPANISIAGTAADSDGQVVSVEIFDGTALLATVVAGTNGAFTYDIANLAIGTYTFKVVATDDKGAKGEATVTVNVTDGTNPGNAWAANVVYKLGDIVTHSGKTYKCTFAHTSLTGWEPPNVPALWQLQ